ncbi:unnamed protein product [Clonostachys chloroleuca]|uniref:Uncharacterized protein n=1 Tax=Clonostachys chloroleuca TaxID=1926264 RepID=A0AA35M675_9HYPO|nr:unnamed protein product [Clonostachys chloroleuca]
MALRYTTEDLLCLRDSPLCVKPENLPPIDEWMGQSPEQPARHQQQNPRGQVGAFDKFRNNVENPLHDQANRRPNVDRHISRNSATNPEDIVFGPPRMAFASSGRATKPTDGDKLKDGDAQGRFGFRSRNEGEGDRLSANRATNPLRRRGDGTDQDSDGWTPVKPRKSFGAENAERFQGRMGGNFRDEKIQSKDPNGRTARPFDAFSRERSMKEENGQPRATTDKNGTEAWHKSKNSEGRVPEKRERIDRAKNWRERDQESEIQDQGNARNADRRWGGDRRVEREPEWLDEPADLKGEARTQQDFQKWMEDMKKTKTGQPPSNESSAIPHEHSFEEPPASAPIITEQGPDKFFMAFGSKNSTEVSSPGDQPEVAASRPKPAGKSSRFTSFFQNHEVRTEPPTPMAAPPPPMGLNMLQQPQPSALGPLTPAAPQDEEKQAFQQLLAKLQKHSMSATPPGPSPFMAPGQPNPAMEAAKKAQMPASPFEALLGGAGRPPPQQPHEIHAPRPQLQTARPEQLLQDLVGHHQRVSSRGSGRPDEGAARNNSNTEFLMNLMRAGSGSTESQLHKQPPPPKGGEREVDFGRDGRGLPRQVRPPPPPGFPLEEGEYMPNPPTILQRPPPPPGLDQMPPNWMGGGGVQLPPLQPPQQPQQRGPMLPPPGLAGGPGRNPPMPPMFPPNFPPGGMPMPEGMGNMPPRNMGPPPLGFFGQMPPGFMPPHGMGGFDGAPGPQSPGGFGPQAPFENRGMPAPGGRGNNFGRG